MLLRRGWPTVDAVHNAHFDDQHYGRTTYLVAWRGDEPLGSALVQWLGPIHPNARAAFPGAVEINHLQVRAALRGHGVGTHIIRAAEELAGSREYSQVAAAVGVENAGAARLYKGLGYAQTGTVDVSEYDWTDSEGQVHHEVEIDELLIKVL